MFQGFTLACTTSNLPHLRPFTSNNTLGTGAERWIGFSPCRRWWTAIITMWRCWLRIPEHGDSRSELMSIAITNWCR